MRTDSKRTRFYPWARALLAMGGICAGTACSITVTPINVGTKTSLERQLVGELEPLSEEQLLAASVRAQAHLGTGSLADLQAAAVDARRRQLFNRDDIDEAKKLGCLGEAREAVLATRPCEAARDSTMAARLARLVSEENADRRAIIDWAVAADSSLTPADRPEVVHVYHRLLVEAARAGDWLEDDEGHWQRR
jgi:uncharacterized protein YdbL (DUF1318 family)